MTTDGSKQTDVNTNGRTLSAHNAVVFTS